MVTTSGSNRLVTLNVTMNNKSPVTALTVGSMIVVRGVKYLSSPKSKVISNAEAQRRIRAYAASLKKEPPGRSVAASNPNIRFDGKLESVVLTIFRPIDDDHLLLTNSKYSREFNVVIPDRKFEALDVRLYDLYARTTRVALGSRYFSAMKYYKTCHNDQQTAWYIEQSALGKFTHDTQLLVSDWCTDLPNPFIDWSIGSPNGSHWSMQVERSTESRIEVYTSSREYVILLHKS